MIKSNLSLFEKLRQCATTGLFLIILTGTIQGKTVLAQEIPLPQNPEELQKYLQEVQKRSREVQEQYSQKAAKVSASAAVWPSEFPVYPNAAPLSVPANPVLTYSQTENRYLISYLLETDDAAETVIEWYKTNAGRFGFFASEDKEMIPAEDLQKIQSVDPNMRAVYLWKPVDGKDGLCKWFLAAAGPDMMLGTESDASGAPKAVACPNAAADPKSEWKPEKPREESNSQCDLSAADLKRITELKKEIKKKFRINIGEIKNSLCGQKDCPNQGPLTLRDIEETQKMLESLPKCFLDKIAGAIIRSPGGTLSSSIEKLTCCPHKSQQAGALGAWMFYDNTVVICGGNAASYGIDTGRVLVHELVHHIQANFNPAISPTTPSIAYLNPLVINWISQTGWIPEGSVNIGLYCYPVI